MPNKDLKNVVRYGWDQIEQEEGDTDGTVIAGNLVERTDNGFAPHSEDAGGVSEVLVAKDMRGRGYEVLDEYPESEFITILKAQGYVGLTLPLASGENVSEDDMLVSDGSGAVRGAAGDGTESDAHIARVEEGVDNSGGSDVEAVKVEVIR